MEWSIMSFVNCLLFVYIGGKMLQDGIGGRDEEAASGIGMAGVLGKKFGTRFAGKATFFGDIILTIIEIENFIK
ncbi:MAG: hypothetical protein ACI4HQ_13035 [Acetatifactor sp.]